MLPNVLQPREADHVPVLAEEVRAYLAVQPGETVIDATFGAGGYTHAILQAANCRVIGIDRDQDAIAHGADLVEEAGGRLSLVEDRFSALADIANGQDVDGEEAQ